MGRLKVRVGVAVKPAVGLVAAVVPRHATGIGAECRDTLQRAVNSAIGDGDARDCPWVNSKCAV